MDNRTKTVLIVILCAICSCSPKGETHLAQALTKEQLCRRYSKSSAEWRRDRLLLQKKIDGTNAIIVYEFDSSFTSITGDSIVESGDSLAVSQKEEMKMLALHFAALSQSFKIKSINGYANNGLTIAVELFENAEAIACSLTLDEGGKCNCRITKKR